MLTAIISVSVCGFGIYIAARLIDAASDSLVQYENNEKRLYNLRRYGK